MSVEGQLGAGWVEYSPILVLISERVEDSACARQRATRHRLQPFYFPSDADEQNVLVVMREVERLHTHWFHEIASSAR